MKMDVEGIKENVDAIKGQENSHGKFVGKKWKTFSFCRVHEDEGKNYEIKNESN